MSGQREVIDVHRKALQINLDALQYGTLAEIGAGQETARWFFRVGGAAGTIAKAISAYDMKFSDAIYGPSRRYVSRERLRAMLGHEYGLVIERLDAARGSTTAFFAFANTVAARSYSRREEGQGWIGIRFQTGPHAAPSQIDIHVRLHGTQSVQDQETLGILGVNLIYGALYLHRDPVGLMESLMDGLYPELVSVDMIDFSGPAFTAVDNRLMALRLVQKGLTTAAMFTAEGAAVHLGEALHGKAVLIERSRFHPPTKLNMNLLECARAQFMAERGIREADLLVVSEMTLRNLTDGGDIDVDDFLHRTEILCALGKNVMISTRGEYHRLAAELFRYTQQPVGVVMGLPTLREIFDEKYYGDLPGGILESFGRLFRYDLRLYVGPSLDADRRRLITVDDFQPPARLRHLYAYLHDNGCIRALQGVRPELLSVFSHEVLAAMRAGQDGWEAHVPRLVAQMIRERRLFGYQPR